MIGVIDPAFLLPREDSIIEREIDLLIETCLHYSIELPALNEYWDDLWSLLGRPLQTGAGSGAKRVLTALRKRGDSCRVTIPETLDPPGAFWMRGFSQLFGGAHFPPPSTATWEERIAAAVLRVLNAGHDAVVLVRLVEDRNLTVHRVGDTTLDEITRWVLHVQPPTIGARQILCVHHPRNIEQRWTARFDWRLPCAADGGPYAFCPPAEWWKGSTISFRTTKSKPCWIDAFGNAWGKPNTEGQPYHWDVYKGAQAQKKGTLDQINVVAYGAPHDQGPPGTIHHVPNGKAHVPVGSGWRCP